MSDNNNTQSRAKEFADGIEEAATLLKESMELFHKYGVDPAPFILELSSGESGGRAPARRQATKHPNALDREVLDAIIRYQEQFGEEPSRRHVLKIVNVSRKKKERDEVEEKDITKSVAWLEKTKAVEVIGERKQRRYQAVKSLKEYDEARTALEKFKSDDVESNISYDDVFSSLVEIVKNAQGQEKSFAELKKLVSESLPTDAEIESSLINRALDKMLGDKQIARASPGKYSL